MHTEFRPRMVHLVSGVLLIVVFLLSMKALGLLSSNRVDAAPQAPFQNFSVTYNGRVNTPRSGRTLFLYTVTGRSAPSNLIHFELQVPACTPPLQVGATSPSETARVGVESTIGLDGITWDQPLQANETRTYSVSFAGNVAEGITQAGVRTSSGYYTVTLPGPACPTTAANSLDVEEHVSSDSVHWVDVDTGPGALVPVGGAVKFRLVVKNNGTQRLTNVALTNSTVDFSSCGMPTTLNPGQSAECEIGPTSVVAGQHTNTATVQAVSGSTAVSDSDSVYYHGGDIQLPAITVMSGAVQSIDANILVVDGINVELAPNSPFLNLLQVGDLVRVEGHLQADGNTTHLVAVYVTMLDTEVAFYRDTVIQSDTAVAADQTTSSSSPANAAPAADQPVADVSATAVPPTAVPPADVPAVEAPTTEAPPAEAPPADAPIDAGRGNEGRGGEGRGNRGGDDEGSGGRGRGSRGGDGAGRGRSNDRQSDQGGADRSGAILGGIVPDGIVPGGLIPDGAVPDGADQGGASRGRGNERQSDQGGPNRGRGNERRDDQGQTDQSGAVHGGASQRGDDQGGANPGPGNERRGDRGRADEGGGNGNDRGNGRGNGRGNR